MNRKWISGAIGLLIVVGCSIGFWKYMNSIETDVTTMQTWKPVKMIQQGQLITSSMIREVSIPTVQHMDNAIVEQSQIIGKRALIPIGETEEFLSWKIGEDKLYPSGEDEYIGFNIDFVGAVNNMVRRGDKVVAWVEYAQPKVLDVSGHEISEAQQQAVLSVEPSAVFTKVYTKQLLNDLTVAYVKDTEGNEIIDADLGGPISLPGSAAHRDEASADHYRQTATGVPAYITFIMSPEEYQTFAAGTKEGTIRLGLPNTLSSFGTITSLQSEAKEPLVEQTTKDSSTTGNLTNSTLPSNQESH
ncbi:SAF domain-containing protein [Paenibacillus sp. MWE-103]|uniref:SAF domain-containing protein n=1 Tax=Paenibacillus artemisiicola TaxID=1172618 RepID=A0ABS3WBZ5_9BACL|nr:SAF domain-containing protein [Paenibacillus artemisiicola]MBO7745812.1 SAF domain-containing protein [Paenibacillus artemisiicola]